MKITKKSRQILLSMVLGDGALNKKGVLSIRHSLAQKNYLEWKNDLLNKNGISTTGTYYVSNNNHGACEFKTYTHNFIKLYKRVLYNPKKNISRKFLNKLNSQGLAIWYMDKGGLSRRKLKNNTYTIKELILNTGFQKVENQIIIDYFNDVWGIKFSQVKNKSVYKLRCGKYEAIKFINIVKKSILQVNCMSYKIDVNHIV